MRSMSLKVMTKKTLVKRALGKGAMGLALSFTFFSFAHSAPVQYVIDPGHTYPSFEADHGGGLSLWRGKFNKSKGMVTLDREAKTGTVDLQIETASMDFGHDKMNAEAISDKMLNAEKFPVITYKGKSMRFEGDTPVEVVGELTLKGVTKPVNLKLTSFKCKPHPFVKREVCGANGEATFNRGDFGVDYALDKGFFPDVKILISVEAIKQE